MQTEPPEFRIDPGDRVTLPIGLDAKHRAGPAMAEPCDEHTAVRRDREAAHSLRGHDTVGFDARDAHLTTAIDAPDRTASRVGDVQRIGMWIERESIRIAGYVMCIDGRPELDRARAGHHDSPPLRTSCRAKLVASVDTSMTFRRVHPSAGGMLASQSAFAPTFHSSS